MNPNTRIPIIFELEGPAKEGDIPSGRLTEKDFAIGNKNETAMPQRLSV
jgi:hypothetical protein